MATRKQPEKDFDDNGLDDDRVWLDEATEVAEAEYLKDDIPPPRRKIKKVGDLDKVQISDQLLMVLESWKWQFDRFYSLMNMYANGDHLKQWGRVDPQAVMAEGYATLAPVAQQLHELLHGKRKRVDELATYLIQVYNEDYIERERKLTDREKQMLVNIDLANQRALNADAQKAAGISMANSECEKRIKDMQEGLDLQRAHMEVEFEQRVDEECRRRLNGEGVQAPGRKLIL